MIQSNQKIVMMFILVASTFILAFASVGVAKTMNKKATPKSIANGKKLYSRACMACHATDGGGTIGPNLTDKAWIHGKGDFHSVMNIIIHGVPAKAMLPKGGLPMSQQDVIDITHYVLSLQGTKPAKPKAAEGKVVK